MVYLVGFFVGWGVDGKGGGRGSGGEMWGVK